MITYRIRPVPNGPPVVDLLEDDRVFCECALMQGQGRNVAARWRRWWFKPSILGPDWERSLEECRTVLLIACDELEETT